MGYKLHKSDAETYDEMLNVLPPENWCSSKEFAHFRMMEYWDGSETTMHARARHDGVDYFASRRIDALDPITWITREQVLVLHGVIK